MIRNLQFTIHKLHISKRQSSFTLIELLVTISVIGMLMVTIIPSLGKYGRTNNVTLAGQTVREALAEIKTNAVSPDPNICPLLPGKSLFWAVNAYAIYANPDANTTVPKNSYPPFLGTPDPVYDDTYQCGQFTDAQTPTLASNQFAVLALHISYDDPLNPTAIHASVMGIVSVGTLDKPAIFTYADGNNNTAINRPILLIYSSPSGSFMAPNKITGLDDVSKTNCNIIPTSGDNIMFGTKKYEVKEADKLYALVSVGYDSSFRSTILVNLFTGQVSSTSRPPSGLKEK